jgi:lipopolysaccharide transport system permease protein
MSLKAEIDSPPTIIIRPEPGLRRLRLQDLWEYRDLIRYMVNRNIHGRYRPTNLGLLWIFITPLAYMGIYTVIFSRLLGVRDDNVPYPMFVYSGITLWFFFQGTVTRTANSLTGNRGIMKKVYYPRLIVPLVVILSELVDYVASLIPLILMFLYYQFIPGFSILTLPFFALLTVIAASALGIWLAALSVNVPDVGLALRPTFRALLYLSPILYPISHIPESWRSWVYLNPLSTLFQGYRWALWGDEPPPVLILLITMGLLILGLTAALFYFRHIERTMVDYL